jgi:hypothetical protein
MTFGCILCACAEERSAASVSTLITPGIVASRRASPAPSASASTTKPRPKHPTGEIGNGAHQDDAPGLKQRNTVTHPLHLIEQVGQEQNRHAFGLEFADQVDKFERGLRI